MKKIGCRISILLIFLVSSALTSFSQQAPPLKKDYRFVMEIPGVINMISSPTHQYVLSDVEGLILFRTRPDTLQWLYSSPGMQKRGNQLRADVRFAYQFGDGKRLTVLEPSSVLGVYSSTQLPVPPKDIARLSDYAYVALDTMGLGRIDLQSPATVDTTLDFEMNSYLGPTARHNVIAVESSFRRLFVLTLASHLHIFEEADGEIKQIEKLQLSKPVVSLFATEKQLLGATVDGRVFSLQATGQLQKLFTIEVGIQEIYPWKSHYVVKDTLDNLWFVENGETVYEWNKSDADNFHVTVNKGRLWLHEFGKISQVHYSEAGSDTAKKDSLTQEMTDSDVAGKELILKDISDRPLPYPHPLLLHLGLETDYPVDQVQFSYKGTRKNAVIRGQGFRWQPSARDVGNQRFTIIASGSGGQVDSTSFTVEVRSFNAPPRFAPVRQMSITTGEEFTLPISARDPDGMSENLVRYMGVDLPDGASVDAKTGLFSWEPHPRQVGKHTFQVIATDQYGPAASVDITMNVIEARRQ